MSSQIGAYTVSDLLSVQHQTVAEFGEDRIADVLANDLRVLNANVQEQMAMVAEPSATLEGRLALYGTSLTGEFHEMDELARPPAQKARVGQTVGFPLRKYGGATGWTRDALAQMSVADFAVQFTQRQKAYIGSLRAALQGAIYGGTNYTYRDRFVQNTIDLPVKAFLNADGAEIPNGPNGETFDGSTLTHYRANNGWDNATLVAAVDALVVHGHTNSPVIVISRGNKTNIEGLAGFTPFSDDRINYVASDSTVQRLDRTNVGNRPIGLFGDAVVWVKPWGVTNYCFIFDAADPRKPLRFRQHHIEGMRGLRIAAEFDDYPLRAQIMDAYFGFGALTRSNGVVVYFGGGAYVAPTFSPIA